MTAPEAGDAAEVRSAAAEANAAEEEVIRDVIDLLKTERELNGDERAVGTLMQNRAALRFACRRLARATDADPRQQPPGWHDREASRT